MKLCHDYLDKNLQSEHGCKEIIEIVENLQGKEKKGHFKSVSRNEAAYNWTSFFSDFS